MAGLAKDEKRLRLCVAGMEEPSEVKGVESVDEGLDCGHGNGR